MSVWWRSWVCWYAIFGCLVLWSAPIEHGLAATALVLLSMAGGLSVLVWAYWQCTPSFRRKISLDRAFLFYWLGSLSVLLAFGLSTQIVPRWQRFSNAMATPQCCGKPLKVNLLYSVLNVSEYCVAIFDSCSIYQGCPPQLATCHLTMATRNQGGLGSHIFLAVQWILSVGLPEELAKGLPLILLGRRDASLIFYGMAAGAGFETMENLKYVIPWDWPHDPTFYSISLKTAGCRLLCSYIHVLWTGLFGMRLAELRDWHWTSVCQALALPAIFHGLYDFFISLGSSSPYQAPIVGKFGVLVVVALSFHVFPLEQPHLLARARVHPLNV